jgi:hypothetical protein
MPFGLPNPLDILEEGAKTALGATPAGTLYNVATQGVGALGDPFGTTPMGLATGVYTGQGPGGVIGQVTGLGAVPVPNVPGPEALGYTYGLDPAYAGELRKRLEAQEQGALAREAYQADFAQAQADYARQQALAGQYENVLAGKGMSLAELQMRQGQQQAMQQAAQMAASARGGTAGLMMAQRSAQQQSALGTAGVARDAAMLRAKEVAEARGQLGGLLGAMRQGSQAQTQTQAQLEMQQRQLNDARAAAQLQAQLDVNRAQLEGSMGYQGAALGARQKQAGMEQESAQKAADKRAGVTGKLAEAGAKKLGLSG